MAKYKWMVYVYRDEKKLKENDTTEIRVFYDKKEADYYRVALEKNGFITRMKIKK